MVLQANAGQCYARCQARSLPSKVRLCECDLCAFAEIGWEDVYVNKTPVIRRIEDAKVQAQQASSALHEVTRGGGLVALVGKLLGQAWPCLFFGAALQPTE